MSGVSFLIVTFAVLVFPAILHSVFYGVGCVMSFLNGATRRERPVMAAATCLTVLLCVTAVASQSNQTDANTAQAASSSDDDSGSVEATAEVSADQEQNQQAQNESPSDDLSKQTEEQKPKDDMVIVLTMDALTDLIDASGGDGQSFNLETLKQAYTLIPMSLNQPTALPPVLRTAVNPTIVRRLFEGDGMEAFRRLLASQAITESEVQTVESLAQELKATVATDDEFRAQHPWIERPGIGQVVAKTEFIESHLTEEMSDAVRDAIRVAVAEKIAEVVEKKFGVEKVVSELPELAEYDFNDAIRDRAIQTVDVYKTGRPEDIMAKTYVLVDLPKETTTSLISVYKREIQQERLILVGIAVGLVWLGIAFSSVVFRTFHADSKVWRMIVIPLISLAVIPCILGAALVVGEMVTGRVL